MSTFSCFVATLDSATSASRTVRFWGFFADDGKGGSKPNARATLRKTIKRSIFQRPLSQSRVSGMAHAVRKAFPPRAVITRQVEYSIIILPHHTPSAGSSCSPPPNVSSDLPKRGCEWPSRSRKKRNGSPTRLIDICYGLVAQSVRRASKTRCELVVSPERYEARRRDPARDGHVSAARRRTVAVADIDLCSVLVVVVWSLLPLPIPIALRNILRHSA